MILILSYSSIYLLAVIADLILDEFQCSCSIQAIQNDVVNTSRAECANKLANGDLHCLSMIFIDEKNTYGVRIDLWFMLLFLGEISLRMFADGMDYFKDWLNVMDLVIILAGIALDLIVLNSPTGDNSNFSLLRLGRLLRIVRIIGTFQKVLKRKKGLAKAKTKTLSTVVTPPTCNWKEAKLAPSSTLAMASNLTGAALGSRCSTRSVPGIGLMVPPSTAPFPKRYACFLSHSKAESAADARYVHDLLQMLLGVDVFLDSSNLVVLRSLFTQLLDCEVLVMIASPSVLQSPWVLLELWTAATNDVPVVTFYKPGFHADAALKFLQEIEEELPKVGGGSALMEVRAHLGKPEGPLPEFKAALIKALHLEEVAEALRRQRKRKEEGDEDAADVEASESGLESSEGAKTHHIAWYPSGSDETILASLRSLCNSMANVTDRELTWTGNEVPISLLSLADDLTEQVGTCRDRFLSMACGLTPRPRAKKNYSLFIAYDPKDVAGRGAARFLQLALQRELRGLVVEELGDEVEGVHMNDDLDELLDDGVKHAEALLLVQTAGCLHRPWTLLQVYEAAKLKKPILCVHVAGSGYDFHTAKVYLRDMRGGLEKLRPGASDVVDELLKSRGNRTFKHMEEELLSVIPNTISVSMNPGDTSEMTAATVERIANLLSKQKAEAKAKLQQATLRKTKLDESAKRMGAKGNELEVIQVQAATTT